MASTDSDISKLYGSNIEGAADIAEQVGGENDAAMVRGLKPKIDDQDYAVTPKQGSISAWLDNTQNKLFDLENVAKSGNVDKATQMNADLIGGIEENYSQLAKVAQYRGGDERLSARAETARKLLDRSYLMKNIDVDMNTPDGSSATRPYSLNSLLSKEDNPFAESFARDQANIDANNPSVPEEYKGLVADNPAFAAYFGTNRDNSINTPTNKKLIGPDGQPIQGGSSVGQDQKNPYDKRILLGTAKKLTDAGLSQDATMSVLNSLEGLQVSGKTADFYSNAILDLSKGADGNLIEGNLQDAQTKIQYAVKKLKESFPAQVKGDENLMGSEEQNDIISCVVSAVSRAAGSFDGIGSVDTILDSVLNKNLTGPDGTSVFDAMKRFRSSGILSVMPGEDLTGTMSEYIMSKLHDSGVLVGQDGYNEESVANNPLVKADKMMKALDGAFSVPNAAPIDPNGLDLSTGAQGYEFAYSLMTSIGPYVSDTLARKNLDVPKEVLDNPADLLKYMLSTGEAKDGGNRGIIRDALLQAMHVSKETADDITDALAGQVNQEGGTIRFDMEAAITAPGITPIDRRSPIEGVESNIADRMIDINNKLSMGSYVPDADVDFVIDNMTKSLGLPDDVDLLGEKFSTREALKTSYIESLRTSGTYADYNRSLSSNVVSLLSSPDTMFSKDATIFEANGKRETVSSMIEYLTNNIPDSEKEKMGFDNIVSLLSMTRANLNGLSSEEADKLMESYSSALAVAAKITQDAKYVFSNSVNVRKNVKTAKSRAAVAFATIEKSIANDEERKRFNLLKKRFKSVFASLDGVANDVEAGVSKKGSVQIARDLLTDDGTILFKLATWTTDPSAAKALYDFMSIKSCDDPVIANAYKRLGEALGASKMANRSIGETVRDINDINSARDNAEDTARFWADVGTTVATVGFGLGQGAKILVKKGIEKQATKVGSQLAGITKQAANGVMDDMASVANRTAKQAGRAFKPVFPPSEAEAKILSQNAFDTLTRNATPAVKLDAKTLAQNAYNTINGNATPAVKLDAKTLAQNAYNTINGGTSVQNPVGGINRGTLGQNMQNAFDGNGPKLPPRIDRGTLGQNIQAGIDRQASFITQDPSFVGPLPYNPSNPSFVGPVPYGPGNPTFVGPAQGTAANVAQAATTQSIQAQASRLSKLWSATKNVGAKTLHAARVSVKPTIGAIGAGGMISVNAYDRHNRGSSDNDASSPGARREYNNNGLSYGEGITEADIFGGLGVQDVSGNIVGAKEYSFGSSLKNIGSAAGIGAVSGAAVGFAFGGVGAVPGAISGAIMGASSALLTEVVGGITRLTTAYQAGKLTDESIIPSLNSCVNSALSVIGDAEAKKRMQDAVNQICNDDNLEVADKLKKVSDVVSSSLQGYVSEIPDHAKPEMARRAMDTLGGVSVFGYLSQKSRASEEERQLAEATSMGTARSEADAARFRREISQLNPQLNSRVATVTKDVVAKAIANVPGATKEHSRIATDYLNATFRELGADGITVLYGNPVIAKEINDRGLAIVRNLAANEKATAREKELLKARIRKDQMTWAAMLKQKQAQIEFNNKKLLNEQSVKSKKEIIDYTEQAKNT